MADGERSNVWERSLKRPLEERDLLENSQISSIDFLRTASVSTGLGLSLDDRRGKAGAASTGESPPLFLLSTSNQGYDQDVQRMYAEMDQLIKNEGKRLRLLILKKVQAEQLKILASVEEKILKKIREKESQTVKINSKNMELEEKLKQLIVELGSWQQRAMYTENLISSLNYKLEQIYAQNLRNNKKGFGDSEIADTASCFSGNANLQPMFKQQEDLKNSMNCVVCRVNQICMLLLPCRHLCLCKDCETKLSSCPLCQSSKFIGMEIYM